MKYDFDFIKEFYKNKKVEVSSQKPDILEINFGGGLVLHFHNAPNDQDSLMAFLGGNWHSHDELTFSDENGFYIDVNYLDFLSLLESGDILVCSEVEDGKLIDRWPVHRKYFDELRFLEAGKELRIARLRVSEDE